MVSATFLETAIVSWIELWRGILGRGILQVLKAFTDANFDEFSTVFQNFKVLEIFISPIKWLWNMFETCSLALKNKTMVHNFFVKFSCDNLLNFRWLAIIKNYKTIKLCLQNLLKVSS